MYADEHSYETVVTLNCNRDVDLLIDTGNGSQLESARPYSLCQDSKLDIFTGCVCECLCVWCLL